jgi:iron complex transport system ATP-binding protein
VAEAMHDADVSHLAARDCQTLSGGEQQRVHLARAMAQIWRSGGVRHGAKPAGSYLLLDEPTSSLDLPHQHAILETARRMTARGLGVLAVLQDVNLAAAYTDRVVLLRDGRIQAQGAVGETLTTDALEGIFGVPLVQLHAPAIAHPIFAVRSARQ